MLNFTGIILAGGKSSRMGADKGLINYRKIPLIQYSIDLLSSFCKEIIISSNNKVYQQFGYPVVGDSYLDKGPAGGLFAALNASSGEWNIVLSCDVPDLNKEALEYLISSNYSGMGVVPVFREKTEPLIGIYHKSFATILEANILSGQLKMQSIIKQSGILLLDFEPVVAKYPNIFKNFNSPQDLLREG